MNAEGETRAYGGANPRTSARWLHRRLKLETSESNSSSMSSEEWCKRDSFTLDLFSPTLLMARGFEGFEEVLGVIESLDVDLRPDKIRHLRPKRKYSRQLLRERLHEAYVGDVFHIRLGRSKPSK